MTDLKPEDLDYAVLQKVAESVDAPHEHARPRVVHSERIVQRRNPSNEHIATTRDEDYAAYIAAFDPPTVLSLLADRARMEKALREAERELAFAVEHMGRTGGGYERALVSVRQALGASQ